MRKVQLRLLKAIQKHDRQWGLYQLDRTINPQEIPEGSTVVEILNLLENRGWIEQCLSVPNNRYAITRVGRCALLQHEVA